MGERIRWTIAYWLNKLPGQCWTELVMFGLGYRRNPWSPIDSACRGDAARCGVCYCGKIGDLRPAATGGGSDG